MVTPGGSRRPSGPGQPSGPYVASLAPLRLHVSGPAEMADTRARMRSWLGCSLTAAHVDDVLLACGEALDNALEHGMPPIVVQLAWLASLDLSVEVHDAGPWMTGVSIHDRGLGMPIMTSLMDAVNIDMTHGTTVSLRRRFEP